MSRYFTTSLSALKPYTPGEQPQDQEYIKLNTNENPYPPSPKVVEAVSSAQVEKLRLYSDPACKDLIETIAARNGLQPNEVMVGNGSDENLFFALRAFCDQEHPLAFADITYGCYKVWCGLLNVPTHIVPLRPDFLLDTKRYCSLNKTIVLANPNAPTGLAVSPKEIEEVLHTNPGNVVIVDEAYVDFGAQSCVPLIHKYANLLVVQTFSKSRSLAGGRLGVAMGDAALIADLNSIKFSLNPYNVNRLTLVAGAAAVQDEAYFQQTCAAIVETREATAQRLRQLGFNVLDSQTNFLFVSTPKMAGQELYLALKSRGILVRHFNAPRISNYLRITVGTPEQMQALTDTLQDILTEE